jgi:quercetin 2,3-dioxygenase
MFQLRNSDARGKADFGWLDSKHSFSFGNYYDPNHMGFRNLRVINEDKVLPNKGFGTHGHKDMEIISYVISGELAHKDSMNNGSTIVPGDVQRMSAGTGVQHSEFNASNNETVHFLQIWILPNQNNHTPGYEERNFAGDRHNTLRLMVSGDSTADALHINADIQLFGSELDAGHILNHTFASDRHGWVQLIKGSLTVSDGSLSHTLSAGDGLGISDVSELTITADVDSEFLLFDLV